VAGESLTARSQRWRIALAIPALLGIFAVGELLLDRFAWRIDLTPQARYSLSERARAVLDGLPADVRIVAFLRSQDPRNLMIEDMLRQAAAHSPRLRVEVLDVNRSPALARQYGVDSYGALVVESEGRRRSLSNPNEDGLTAALLQVTRQQRRTIGWLMGHGEGDLESLDRTRGFSTARTLLEHEYYDVRPVSLLGDEVPPEVEVLVVAGPQKDLLADELSALDRYLQRGGHTLVMLDPQRAPGLARLLRRYGIEVGGDTVVDPARRLYGGEYLTMQLPLNRGDHAILEPMEVAPLFSLTRSVRPVPADGVVASAVFLRTSEESWATSDAASVRTGAPRFVSGRDTQGPVPVGAEVVFQPIGAPGAPPVEGRLVVYGNAEFANNFFIKILGNEDLFLNTIAWLARDTAGIAHHPFAAQLGIEQFFISNEDAERAFWGTAVVVPGLLALVGLGLVWQRRRA
jgi:ABC-type uncharacterized transport system involved in gliding motility auxiliary subunit